MKTQTIGDVLTAAELAEYLHCTQSTVYNLVSRGELPCFRLGGGLRFKRELLEKWASRGGGPSICEYIGKILWKADCSH
jgi:putative molybdopterin biosynthesis protein